MSKKRHPPAQFPVALFKLDPENIGYTQGKRYRIDTVDGTCFFFVTANLNGDPSKEDPQTDAIAFMHLHGMRHVELTEVETLRKAMRAKPEDSDESLLDDDIEEDEGPMA